MRLTIYYSLLLALLFPLAANSANSEEFSIGVVIPLTGGNSSSGESIRNSIQLADQLYDKENRVSFRFEDNQFMPGKTVSAVKKLINYDKIDALIVYGSPTSLAVNQLAEAAKVPMVGMSVVERLVENKKFVMKHWVSAQAENLVLTKEVEKRGYKSVAIVSTTNDAMLRLRDLFKQSFTGTLVFDEEFLPDDLDFRAISTKIANSAVDAVYILLWPPQPGVFAKQLRAAGYGGQLFGTHNIEDPDEVAASKGALHGAWYATGDDSAAQVYYAKYENQFGGTPANGGINSFDIAKMMIEGLGTEDLNRYLHELKNFKGAYGSYNATENNDFMIPATIKVITSSGFDFLTED